MLFYLLNVLTLFVLLAAMWYAYHATRDPLHPVIYLAPLCIYSYVFKPLLLAYLASLTRFFDDRQLIYIQVLNSLGVAAFCIGALHHGRDVRRLRVSNETPGAGIATLLTPEARLRVAAIAWFLGALAVAAYAFTVVSVGGLEVAYGQAYGGARSMSGYLNDAPMLCLASIGLFYLAWAGQPISIHRILILVAVASPLLVHGLLGARRGPTFMVLGALFVGGFMASARRPRLVTVFVGVFLLGSLILFLVNNRHRIYLGSSALEEWSMGTSRQLLQNVDAGDDWVHSGGTILTSRNSGTHFWGSRMFMMTFLRPIPRAIWPDKYIATGFAWMDGQEDMLGMTDKEWITAVGWIPARGAAAGFVADLYLEFWWFGLIACWLLGWTYSWLWKNMVLKRGIWVLFYLYAVILSIYVPTQNVTDAWVYRMILLSVPTVFLWYIFVQPVLQPRNMAGYFRHNPVENEFERKVSRRRRIARPRFRPSATSERGLE